MRKLSKKDQEVRDFMDRNFPDRLDKMRFLRYCHDLNLDPDYLIHQEAKEKRKQQQKLLLQHKIGNIQNQRMQKRQAKLLEKMNISTPMYPQQVSSHQNSFKPNIQPSSHPVSVAQYAPVTSSFQITFSTTSLPPDFLKAVFAYDHDEPWADNFLRQSEEKFGKDVFDDMFAKARLQIYSDSAAKGSIEAQYYVGVSLVVLGDPQGEAILDKLAIQNDLSALGYLAEDYDGFGNFPENKAKKAHYMLRLAQVTHSPEDQYNIAELYFEYHDFNNAITWYQEVTKQDSSKGFAGYGKIYFNRSIIKTDIGEIKECQANAYYYLHKALENKCAQRTAIDVFWWLAQLHENRTSQYYNLKEALRCYYILTSLNDNDDYPSLLKRLNASKKEIAAHRISQLTSFVSILPEEIETWKREIATRNCP